MIERKVMTKKCDECPRMVPHDLLHPLEDGQGNKTQLCDWCCPNCFGGPGQGPTEENRSTSHTIRR